MGSSGCGADAGRAADHLSLIHIFILGAQTLYNYLSGHAVEGFTTVILLLLFIGSVLALGLGVIGHYIAKIYDEVKGRPIYIVEKTTEPLKGREDGR